MLAKNGFESNREAIAQAVSQKFKKQFARMVTGEET